MNEISVAFDSLPKLLSPLGIFGFALICCSAFLARIASTCSQYDPQAFKWVIHSFLSIFAIFVLTAIYCPSLILSPTDRVALAMHSIEVQNNDRPEVVLQAMAGGIILYMLYQKWASRPK